MSARHSPIFMILNVRVRFKFRKEGNVLFNDALNTFYLSLKQGCNLYGVGRFKFSDTELRIGYLGLGYGFIYRYGGGVRAEIFLMMTIEYKYYY